MHNAPQRWMRSNKGEVNFKIMLIFCAVLVEVELVFFTVLGTWPFWKFVLETELIIQRSFSHC